MPAAARSSSVSSGGSYCGQTRSSSPTSIPARSASLSMIGRNRTSKNSSANCRFAARSGANRATVPSAPAKRPARRIPSRPSAAGSCRGRRRVPTDAGCRRTLPAGSAAPRPSGASRRALRPARRAGGSTRRQSRPRYRRGARPHLPVARTTWRPASCSSSASCTPVWPEPTISTPPGGSWPGFR